jgi:hypothetical protein
MRAAGGTSWSSFPTQFDGQHLVARFDDASLAPGGYVIDATSCDNAGNCASSEETLTLPVRTASVSNVGFEKAKHIVRRCAGKQARIARHKRHTRRLCRSPKLVRKGHERVPFGRAAFLGGLLTTAQGTPIPDANVAILAAPNNGLAQYRQIAAASTDAAGAWQVRVPPGPSRLISAVYAGSSTIQPSRGEVKLIVPASIRVLRVWPRHVPWGGKVHLKAKLVGGFLPAGGALVRLRLGFGDAKITYGVQEHVAGNGTFRVTNAFGPGPPGLVRRYWLQECTLPEGNYPYAPACGPRSGVTVGGST